MTQHEAPTGSQIIDEKIAKRRAQKAARQVQSPKPNAAKGSQILMDLKSGTPSVQAPSPRSASVPHTASTTAVAVADARPYRERYLDEVSLPTLAGRMLKFDKNAEFVTPDDEKVVPAGTEFVALCPETLVGWIKFAGVGEPPTRVMGLWFDNFCMPSRESLGDLDQSEWETGLDGAPSDPWTHQMCLVLQSCETKELFTFVTSSKTGRRAVGNLLRHFTRMQKTNPDELPRVRLGKGGFAHRDKKIGWVDVPNFVVVGRAPRDGIAKPEPTAIRDSIEDDLPEHM